VTKRPRSDDDGNPNESHAQSPVYNLMLQRRSQPRQCEARSHYWRRRHSQELWSSRQRRQWWGRRRKPNGSWTSRRGMHVCSAHEVLRGMHKSVSGGLRDCLIYESGAQADAGRAGEHSQAKRRQCETPHIGPCAMGYALCGSGVWPPGLGPGPGGRGAPASCKGGAVLYLPALRRQAPRWARGRVRGPRPQGSLPAPGPRPPRPLVGPICDCEKKWTLGFK
jgi:hypothetical protein